MKNKPIENKKIKVVEVSSDSNIGGAGKCILTFLKTFDREKFDVSVILPRNSLLKPEVEKYRVKVFEADNLAEKSLDRKSTRLNSSHSRKSRMPSSA